jgi:hypothetical protein
MDTRWERTKCDKMKNKLPPGGTQPLAMNLHTEPLVKSDPTVMCRALKHVQSQGDMWTRSARSQKKVGKKAAASREPDLDIEARKCKDIHSKRKTKEIRYCPAENPTTSESCTRRPDTERTTQSCDKVKPGRVTGKGSWC